MALDVELVGAMIASLVAVGIATLVLRLAHKRAMGNKPPCAPALDPTTFKAFKLVTKTVVSHDTRIFRFALDKPTDTLGLPVGKHMALRAVIAGEAVQRSYTPISSNDDKGYFDLLIKVYFPNVHPKFPAGGKLSQYLESMKIGDSIDVRGPHGKFEYLGNGRYTLTVPKSEPRKGVARQLSMCAGGTGITPLLQIIRHIQKDPSDRTSVKLIFANQTVDDILLRAELDALKSDDRFSVWYTVDRPPTEGWTYSEGFINKSMVETRLFPPSSETLVLMCGPPPMIEFACKPNLLAVGYVAEQLVTF